MVGPPGDDVRTVLHGEVPAGLVLLGSQAASPHAEVLPKLPRERLARLPMACPHGHERILRQGAPHHLHAISAGPVCQGRDSCSDPNPTAKAEGLGEVEEREAATTKGTTRPHRKGARRSGRRQPPRGSPQRDGQLTRHGPRRPWRQQDSATPSPRCSRRHTRGVSGHPSSWPAWKASHQDRARTTSSWEAARPGNHAKATTNWPRNPAPAQWTNSPVASGPGARRSPRTRSC